MSVSVCVCVCTGLYVKFQYFSPYEEDGITSTNNLPSIPTEEIFAAAIGFLSYKIPLLYESTKEVTPILRPTT